MALIQCTKKLLDKLFNISKVIIIGLLCVTNTAFATEEITPYKYTDQDKEMTSYNIPTSSRFTTKRSDKNAPDIVYYFSKPKSATYPIAILCGGSTSKGDIGSIIHFHRYFLKEFLDLGVGVLTAEQWGVDGSKVNTQEFVDHYTRSQRLHDYEAVINHLKVKPPEGWNGKLIFLGVSEGGPIVTKLTIDYANITTATMVWSGVGDWSWRDELWVFIEDMKKQAPWWMKLWGLMPRWLPFAFDLPKTRYDYDTLMDEILKTPDANQEFMGMSYKYHEDALTWPAPEYQKIHTPFLVVTGAQDSTVDSSDAFVEKARSAGANITYLRISDMDHYIRKRPDVIEKSFAWLRQQIK